MKKELFDGKILQAAFCGAEKYVEEHIDELNILNVFPVPDGDTGINMFLTLQSANKAWANVNTNSASTVSAAAARGALLGACGNSGVILSQILRGIAKGLEMKDRFSCIHFAQALQTAAEMARSGVVNPVEGTILTVAREASEMAMRMAERGASFRQMMTAIVSQSKKTVQKTPELLPQLKEAGVVDAGAKGLLYVFQGMRDHMWNRYTRSKTHEQMTFVNVQTKINSESYGYDLQFLIRGNNLPLDIMRGKIETMGESVMVVGDDELIRVHIHTVKPDDVLAYAQDLGKITDLIKENLDEQVQEFRAKHN
ncbi:DAK2 domain-containing protein [Chloroflexota bacterium]